MLYPPQDTAFHSVQNIELKSGYQFPTRAENLKLNFAFPSGRLVVDGTQIAISLGFQVFGKNKKNLPEGVQGSVINAIGSGSCIERVIISNHGKIVHRYDQYWIGMFVPCVMERSSNWFKSLGKCGAFEIEEGVLQGEDLFRANPSAMNRASLCEKSAEFNTYSTFILPIFSNEKVVPLYGTSINIEISFLPDCMTLIKDPKEQETLELYITHASLNMKLLEPDPSMAVSLSMGGKFGTRDFSVETFTLLAGTLSKSLPYNTYQKTPTKMYICMADEESLTSQEKNPLYFPAHGLESVQISANERIITVGEDLVFIHDKETGHPVNVSLLYFKMFQLVLGNLNPAISLEHFSDSYSILLADLTSKHTLFPQIHTYVLCKKCFFFRFWVCFILRFHFCSK